MRMRQRRIERLLVRADAAIETGSLDAAREAVDELERLSPETPGLQPLRTRLSRAPEPVVARPVLAPPVPPAPAAVETPTVVSVTPVQPDMLKPPAERVDAGRPRKPPPVQIVKPPPAPAAASLPDILDTPAASAPLRAETAVASEPANPKRSRLPQVAAAILILGSLGWLAVPRVPWMERGARSTASPPSVVPAAAAPAAPAPLREAVTAQGVPPAVDVAVIEITPEETAAPVAPSARADTPERAQPAALVGNAIPAAQPTTDAAPAFVSTAPAATLPPRRPEPSELPSNTAPVPFASEPAAAEPVLARATEPLPVPPPVAAPEPAPAATASAPPPAPADAAIANQSRILATLGRYEAAYSNLDVNAAGAVWPTLDRRALARAFEGLSSQRVNLGNCDVRVAGETAVAECSGTAVWTPKVGGGSHRQPRRWQFRLRNESGAWQIVSANVK